MGFCFVLFCFQVFLKSDRVARMVQSGGCSANDFREVFKKNIEKRVRSLPEIDGLSKETVLSSWIAKYDAISRGEEDLCKPPNRMALSAVSELILSKEQLYEMFQQILGIKKLEHQLLYNACQVSDYAISCSAVWLRKWIPSVCKPIKRYFTFSHHFVWKFEWNWILISQIMTFGRSFKELFDRRRRIFVHFIQQVIVHMCAILDHQICTFWVYMGHALNS